MTGGLEKIPFKNIVFSDAVQQTLIARLSVLSDILKTHPDLESVAHENGCTLEASFGQLYPNGTLMIYGFYHGSNFRVLEPLPIMMLQSGFLIRNET